MVAARVVLVVIALASAVHEATARPDDRSQDRFERLPPRRFAWLPSRVTKAFEAAECTIPQRFDERGRINNVVRGHFASPGQWDYAALCSRGGRSHIHVVWGGRVRCSSEIAEDDDAAYIDGGGDQPAHYGRSIDVVTQATIDYFRRGIGGPEQPDRSHSGIDDYLVGRASVIRYCSAGRWHELQGMD